MVFTIEEDEDIDYSATPVEPTAPEMIVPTTETESSGLLGDRVVGTMGFCGALLSTTCCCFGRGLHREEIAHTYNKHTLFGLCCPFR